MIIAGKRTSRQLFEAIGFKNDDVGSNAMLAAIWKMGIGAMGTFSKETWFYMNKLLFPCNVGAAQEKSSDNEAWIATQDLAELNKVGLHKY